jgi:hypothetical protein
MYIHVLRITNRPPGLFGSVRERKRIIEKREHSRYCMLFDYVYLVAMIGGELVRGVSYLALIVVWKNECDACWWICLGHYPKVGSGIWSITWCRESTLYRACLARACLHARNFATENLATCRTSPCVSAITARPTEHRHSRTQWIHAQWVLSPCAPWTT